MGASYRRSLIVNAISKYWWVGRQLYDEGAEDPFHLASYLEVNYSTKSLDLLSSSYANNNEIIQAMVEAFMELEVETGRRLSREEIRKTSVNLNILGGISALDCFGKEGLKGKIKERFYKWVENSIG